MAIMYRSIGMNGVYMNVLFIIPVINA